MGLLNGIFKSGKKKTQFRYTSEEIKKSVDDAISVMENCKTIEDIKKVFQNIVDIVGDKNLAFELYCFIPDIYCRVIIPEVKYDDEIIFKTEDGKVFEMSATGFTGYLQIQKELFERIKLKLDTDKQEKILVHSLNFNAINKALSGGSEVEDLITGPMVLNAPSGYTPFRYNDGNRE